MMELVAEGQSADLYPHLQQRGAPQRALLQMLPFERFIDRDQCDTFSIADDRGILNPCGHRSNPMAKLPPLPPDFEAFLKHWKTLGSGSNHPELKTYLDRPYIPGQPWMFIIDVDSTEMQKIRFLGTGIVEFFGLENTGDNFLTVIAEEALPNFIKTHLEVPLIPCGMYHTSECRSSTGRVVQMAAICLPVFRANGGKSVIWFTKMLSDLRHSERGVRLLRVTGEKWLDLGYGVPQ